MGNTTENGRPPQEPLLPANEDAERFVLGSILDNDQLFGAACILRTSDFSIERHRRIFRRMGDLHKRGERIDLTTVLLELQNNNESEPDTLDYLIHLDHGLPHLPQIDSYIRKVIEASQRRRLFWAGQQQMLSATNPSQDLAGLLLIQRKHLDEVEERCQNRNNELDELPSIWSSEVKLSFLVEDLLLDGGVTMVAGAPGDGKSTLALALAAAVAQGKPFLER